VIYLHAHSLRHGVDFYHIGGPRPEFCQCEIMRWRSLSGKYIIFVTDFWVIYTCTHGADWAAWLRGTSQVGQFVRRPGGPPRQNAEGGSV